MATYEAKGESSCARRRLQDAMFIDKMVDSTTDSKDADRPQRDDKTAEVCDRFALAFVRNIIATTPPSHKHDARGYDSP